MSHWLEVRKCHCHVMNQPITANNSVIVGNQLEIVSANNDNDKVSFVSNYITTNN